jgi:hypothetical protein
MNIVYVRVDVPGLHLDDLPHCAPPPLLVRPLDHQRALPGAPYVPY